MKILGVQVSDNLKWQDHVTMLLPQLRTRLFHLRRFKGRVSSKYLRQFALSFFVSKIRYAMSVYFTVRITDEDPEPSNLKPLKVIFNDMLRLLHGTTRAKKVPIKTMLQSCLLYTSPSPRDLSTSRMPSSA